MPNERIIEVVAGMDEEAWLALESGGTLLSFTGEDFEVINEEVTDISEVPGVQLDFEYVLVATSTGCARSRAIRADLVRCQIWAFPPGIWRSACLDSTPIGDPHRVSRRGTDG